MKDKWMIPVLLFVVLLLCNIARGFFQTRIMLEMLQTDRIEESAIGSGVIIKTEHCATLPTGGTTEIVVSDGDRVAKGEMIAMVYSGEQDEQTRVRLADVNKRIAAMEKSHAGDRVFLNDVTKIESEIASSVDAVIAQTAEYNLESLSEYKYSISTMADQKAVAKGEKETFANDLVQLRSERSVLEAALGKVELVATADIPGIFVEGHDGFEQELTSETLLSLTPQTINDVISREKNDRITQAEKETYTYKIVNNYAYYIAQNLDDAFCTFAVGDSVQLRFSDLAVGAVPAKIVHISDKDATGQRCVVAECTKHVEGLLQSRVVNVEFIKKSISGYKVKTEYLHTVDNAVGLFIKRGAVMKFIPVTVVYSTEEEAIVSAAGTDKPIKAYDEVVTAAPEFVDGKVIVSQ